MATYVLVHGGSHGGWCYQLLARILRAKGHDVYTPTMTGLGEREHLLNPNVDLNMHITDIVKVLQFEDLRNVILVGHSYGGMVITGVADRAADRIGHLVWLDSAIPRNGQSLVDYAPGIVATRANSRLVDGAELVNFPGKDPMGDPYGLYGVKDPELIAWMAPKLTPHPWKCFEQKLHLSNEAAIRKLPQTAIVCTQNLASHKTLFDGRIWDIDTGHDLMISEPEKVAEMLMRI